MKDIEKTLKTIRQAIEALDAALIEPNLAPKGSTKEQLQYIRQALVLMLDDLVSQSVSIFESERRSFGRIIGDSWPINSQLGEILLKAEHEYIQICKQLRTS